MSFSTTADNHSGHLPQLNHQFLIREHLLQIGVTHFCNFYSGIFIVFVSVYLGLLGNERDCFGVYLIASFLGFVHWFVSFRNYHYITVGHSKQKL